MVKEKLYEKTSKRLFIAGVITVAVIILLAMFLLLMFAQPDKKSYSTSDLNRALLTLDDMPTGWTGSPTESEVREDEEFNDLFGREFDIKANALTSANIQFSGGFVGPLVIHGVAVYPEGEAEKLFDEFTRSFETYQEWKDVAGTNWHAAKLAFPEFGSDSAAFRVSGTTSLVGVLEAHLVIIRDGDFLNLLMHTDIGMDSVDTELTEKFARRADEKLWDVIG